MKFNEIWDRLQEKRPDLANDEKWVTMSSENLRALLRQVYDQGFDEGKQTGGQPDLRDIFGFG